jgi:isopenicillin N synthase-like dioxygenase
MELLNEIPSLDLADFQSLDPVRKKQFVEDLGRAFHTIGFVALKGHGLTNNFNKELYQSVEQFFQSSDEIKQKYEIPGIAGQRGYVGKGKETAKGFKVPDLKEFYHVGQPHQNDGDSVWSEYPANVFPEEIPLFGQTTVQAYQTLEAAGKSILQAIALYLNLEEDYFELKVKNGNSILRAIHYFPILNPDSLPEGAVRAAAHGDINLITLLMGASAEGLEVLRMDGKWIPITALPDQVVINVGDMLDRLTNHKLKSTIHRVVNPPKDKMGSPRYSIPFFMHPRSEMDLSCLPSCVTTEEPKLYTDMTAGAFLDERLIELGLKKKS